MRRSGYKRRFSYSMRTFKVIHNCGQATMEMVTIGLPKARQDALWGTFVAGSGL